MLIASLLVKFLFVHCARHYTHACTGVGHIVLILTYIHRGRVSFRGGRTKGGNCPPLDICAPLGFKILNDLPVYGQLVTLTIRSNF